MNKKKTAALQGWLEAIMPDVVGTFVDGCSAEKLSEFAQEGGVHGPFSINLRSLKAPVESIDFYFMFAGGSAMLAVSSTIAGAPEGYTPQLNFDLFFPDLSSYADTLASDANIQKLVTTVMEQYKEACGGEG